MKVLIADDHAIVREGIRQIVKTLLKVTLIDEVAEGNLAMEMIRSNGYDMVILDISMPGLSGLDILQAIKDRNIPTNVLVLSFHPQEQYALRAFKLGAAGYVCKDGNFDEISAAIQKIANGGRYISPAFAEKLIFNNGDQHDILPHVNLSQREFQIMILLAKGISVTEIAGMLFISDKTVSTHRARIMDKMGMTKNAELTLYASRHHLV